MLEVLNLNHFKLIIICSENRHKSPYFPDLLSVPHCHSRGDEKWGGFISVGIHTCLIYISNGIAFHYWNVFTFFWQNISYKEIFKASAGTKAARILFCKANFAVGCIVMQWEATVCIQLYCYRPNVIVSRSYKLPDVDNQLQCVSLSPFAEGKCKNWLSP